MKILAIDTSGQSAGLAILEDDNPLYEININMEIHHSEILLPALDDMCRATGIAVKDMDLFACTTGPGSFTGLRIGLSTVKGMAMATGKPVVGVSTLEALACNAMQSSLTVCPVMDARKNQIYAAMFKTDPSCVPDRFGPDALAEVDTFLGSIKGRALFLGDGAVRYAKEILAFLGDQCCFGESIQHRIRGAAVGFLGYRKYRAGEVDDALTIMPRYLRLSEAEEKKRLAGMHNEPDRH
ncbi:MAG: tRNA threonylcarbamoyladenosine biosynthesis protein TsaB [Syntrophus sp. SKADARSKE-3]|nr:tRNA threonylcarbamoyladenosine biosynthesis protein TsaB [Syntrophus sp. SKADARSKE-3]